MNINFSKIQLCIQQKLEQFDTYLDEKITEIFFINIEHKSCQTDFIICDCCKNFHNFKPITTPLNIMDVSPRIISETTIVNQPDMIDKIDINIIEDNLGYMDIENKLKTTPNNNIVTNPLTYGTCNNTAPTNLFQSIYISSSDSDDNLDAEDFANNTNDDLVTNADDDNKYSSNDEYDKLDDYNDIADYDKLDDYNQFEDFDEIDDKTEDEIDDEIHNHVYKKKDN